MKQPKSSKSRSTKRKIVSVATVLLATVQIPVTTSAVVSAFGWFSLTNLVTTSLVNDYSRMVAPGLVETRFTYTNLSCRINECFMLEYEPLAGQIGVTVGTPGDTTYAGGYYAATVRAQTASAMANGRLVVAAVSGDMFNMTTSQPWGVVVKDGVKVQGIVSSRTYRWSSFRIKKDGTPVTTSNVDYSQIKSEPQNTIGLYDTLLVKDGSVVTQKDADQRTYSPRFGIDVRADGTVFFVMVDDRQSQYSTGATLKKFAQLMKNIGAVQADSLDAGGPATLLSHNYGDSALLLRNKPFDDEERLVPNSLLFVTRSTPV